MRTTPRFAGSSVRAIRRGTVLRAGVQDLARAADLFAPIHERTAGVDGWVSLESRRCLLTTKARWRRPRPCTKANRPNLFIKIPGTKEGAPAIEEAIFAGCAGQRNSAVLPRSLRGRRRGLHARTGAAHRAGLKPDVRSVASLFISRWDKADDGQSARERSRQAGRRHRPASLQGVPRRARVGSLAAAGELRRTRRNGCSSPAPAPRIPRLPTSFISGALAAPNTVNTMPEETLLAFGEHGRGGWVIPRDGARLRTGARRSSAGSESTWRSSAPTCRRREPSLSSTPGRNC